METGVSSPTFVEPLYTSTLSPASHVAVMLLASPERPRVFPPSPKPTATSSMQSSAEGTSISKSSLTEQLQKRAATASVHIHRRFIIRYSFSFMSFIATSSCSQPPDWPA